MTDLEKIEKRILELKELLTTAKHLSPYRAILLPTHRAELEAELEKLLTMRQFTLDKRRNYSKGGDINIKAGDGGPNGNGGSIELGPGIYKAGDAAQMVNKPREGLVSKFFWQFIVVIAATVVATLIIYYIFGIKQ